MAEPNSTSSSLGSMSLAWAVAILFFIGIMFVFRTVDITTSRFTVILWIVIPLAVFFIISLVNLASQQFTCGKVNAGKAFLGGLPSIVTTWIGLGIATRPYCRIPVASVFAPLIAGAELNVVQDKTAGNALNAVRNRTTKKCCTPIVSLESVERAFPDVAGCAYGFYAMFGILFGYVFGNGFATIC